MKDFGMSFFGRRHFGCEERMDARKKFREEWNKMTDSEKIDFMNKKMEMMDEMENRMKEFHNKDRFTVESMDERCLEWMKKTPQEKEEFMNKRRQAFNGWHGEN